MMKGIFTKTLAAFLAVGFVLSVGGCGDSSSQVSSGTVKSDYTLPDVELENKTLKFYVGMGTGFSESEDPSRPTADELFRDLYGGTIEFINVSWDNYYGTLLGYYMADDMPDLLWPMPETFPTDILNNLIQPVDPYSDYIDLSDSIWDSTRDLTEMLTINGKHYYAVSGGGTNVFTCYNPKLFSLYGLETPLEIYTRNPDEWTWDKMLQLAKELTDDTDGDGQIDQWGVGIAANGPHVFQESTGMPFVSYSQETSVVNNIRSAEIADAANFVRDLGPALHNVLDPSMSYEVPDRFLAGNDAMVIDFQWRALSTYQNLWSQGKLEIAPVPRYPKTDKFYVGGVIWSFLIANKAKNPEAAALYMTLNRYTTSEAYKETYGIAAEEQRFKNWTEMGISLEQCRLMEQMSEDRDTFPVVLNLWCGWYDKEWYNGFIDLQQETWSQILERVEPIYNRRINSRLEEFNAILSGGSTTAGDGAG